MTLTTGMTTKKQWRSGSENWTMDHWNSWVVLL